MHLATPKAWLVHTDLVFGIYTVECWASGLAGVWSEAMT